MSAMRPELPREFVASHKRRRMMDAIAELTAEGGYEATKIADIVRRAAVARKTLYDNFDGKEDLFLSAIDATMAEMRELVEDACAEADSTGGRDRRRPRGRARLRRRAPGGVADVHGRGDLGHAQLGPPLRRRRARLRRAVPRKSAPQGTDLPETIEESLVGGVAWILQLQIRRGEAEQAAELLPELSQFVLSPYLGVGKVVDTGRRK